MATNGYLPSLMFTILKTFPKYLFRSSHGGSLILWKENSNIVKYRKTLPKLKICRPDFKNIEKSLNIKTNAELLRAIVVLYICSFRLISVHSIFLMKATKFLLRERLFKYLMKSTIYGQFAGGETEDELEKVSLNLNKRGINILLMLACEDDLARISGRGKYHNKLLINLSGSLNCVKIARKLCGHVIPMIHFKMTAFAPQSLLVELGLRTQKVEDFRFYVFELLKLLNEDNVKLEQTIFNSLTPSEQLFLSNAVGCLRKFGESAINEGVRLLVDAEYTMLNRGIQLFTIALMFKHNKAKPMVWNTHQCYLKTAFDTLLEELDTVQGNNRCWGAKIVRGAYMESETKSAISNKVPNPINESFEKTSEMYDRVVYHILNKISKKENKYSLIAATQNEQSILKVVDLMEKLDINPTSKYVSFGQLYGVSDNVTYALGMSGYNVYKSVPYGLLMDVLPYLSRRAAENSSVLNNTSVERGLMAKELKRRFLNPQNHQQ
ncbi:hydroxyproline dehydrogenase-like [Octopus sinensis]|uniref:Proline dehydrogenase n=1 Tax=Octopus sinensis TaxID=2607531 RepID=A0A6P7TUI4_9MOLL|nr:hydroxyproline dehydrogenase-like [Octopus sinensis]